MNLPYKVYCQNVDLRKRIDFYLFGYSDHTVSNSSSLCRTHLSCIPARYSLTTGSARR